MVIMTINEEKATDEILTKENLKKFLEAYEKEIKAENWNAIVNSIEKNRGGETMDILKAIFSDILDEDILTKLDHIPANFFYGDEKIKELNIPNNIQKISSNAFRSCINLEKVVMPDTITEMGESVFKGCKALNNVRLSEKLSTIPNNTFEDCSSLEKLFIPDSISSIGYSVFKNCPEDMVIEINRGVVRDPDPQSEHPHAIKMKSETGEFVRNHVKWIEK